MGTTLRGSSKAKVSYEETNYFAHLTSQNTQLPAMPEALPDRKLASWRAPKGSLGLLFLIGLLGGVSRGLAEAPLVVEPFDPIRMLPHVHDDKMCDEFKTLGRIRAIGPASAYYFQATFQVHTRQSSRVGIKIADDFVSHLEDSCGCRPPRMVS